MVIKPNPNKIQTAPDGWVWDYALPTEDVGISYQEYNGKGPKEGYWINTVCWEAYFIISGTGTITIDDKIEKVEKGDLVIMLPGQKASLIADHLKMVTITRPNWYEEQAKIVES